MVLAQPFNAGLLGSGKLGFDTLASYGSSGGRAAYPGVVATRCRIAHRYNASLVNITARTAHIATDDIVRVKALFWNGRIDEAILSGGTPDYTEKGTGGAITRTAVLRYPLGTINRLQVGGLNSWSEANNALTETDWKTLTTPVPKGSKFFMEQWLNGPAGIPILSTVGNNEMNTSFGDQTSLDAADKTGTTWTDGSFGGATFGAADGYGLFPLAIIGMTRKGTMMVLSTSIGEGIFDTGDASGDLGHICRSLGAAGIGYIDCSVSGDSHAKIIASHAIRQALQQYVTHVFLDGPTNDSLASEPTLEANIQTILAYFPTKTRVMATPMPKTTGAWTLINQTDQTIGSDFETIGVGPYIRAKPVNVSAVYDMTSVVATGVRGNRYWNADGTAAKWTGDGVHPKLFTYQSIQSALGAAIAASCQ